VLWAAASVTLNQGDCASWQAISRIMNVEKMRMGTPSQSTYTVFAATFASLLERARAGQTIDGLVLAQIQASFERARQSPNSSSAQLDEINIEEPWASVELALSGDETPPVRCILRNRDAMLSERSNAVKELVDHAFREFPGEVENVLALFREWMWNRTIVHVIGAGRALLAASLPANRLAHAGANVYILGDKSPPPNSRFGGGIIAASASGKTRTVLEIMSFAQRANRERPWPGMQEIKIVGIADERAAAVDAFPPFRDLCSPGCFLGIPKNTEVGLRALADIEELAISAILDALVVIAAREIGVNFFRGHEDLVGGATGPWHQRSKE